jgi:hypothetical protein
MAEKRNQARCSLPWSCRPRHRHRMEQWSLVGSHHLTRSQWSLFLLHPVKQTLVIFASVGKGARSIVGYSGMSWQINHGALTGRGLCVWTRRSFWPMRLDGRWWGPLSGRESESRIPSAHTGCNFKCLGGGLVSDGWWLQRKIVGVDIMSRVEVKLDAVRRKRRGR